MLSDQGRDMKWGNGASPEEQGGRGWGDGTVPLTSGFVPPDVVRPDGRLGSKPASAGEPPGLWTAGREGDAARFGRIELRALIFLADREKNLKLGLTTGPIRLARNSRYSLVVSAMRRHATSGPIGFWVDFGSWEHEACV